MPTTQQEYDALVFRLRQMGHILESSPNNIMNGLNRNHRDTVAITESKQVCMVCTGYEPTSQSSQPNYPAGWAAQGSVFGGCSSSRGSATLDSSFLGDYDSGDGTDSDTASSCGEADADFATSLATIAHLPDAEKEQYIYWAYRQRCLRCSRGVCITGFCAVPESEVLVTDMAPVVTVPTVVCFLPHQVCLIVGVLADLVESRTKVGSAISCLPPFCAAFNPSTAPCSGEDSSVGTTQPWPKVRVSTNTCDSSKNATLGCVAC